MMQSFVDVLQKVEECNATRLQLTADVAESSHLIKALLIRAEDARIQGHIKQVPAQRPLTLHDDDDT